MTDPRLVMLEGRRVAEARLTDGCRIRTGASGRQWNESTKDYDDAPAATYSYTGPCLIKASGNTPRMVDAAGQTVILQQPEIHLPFLSSSEVRPGHVVEILASATDPGLPGREFRITGPFNQTYATARRFPVEEATSA